MKRFFALLLFLLLLTGCAVHEQPEDSTTFTEVADPPISSLLDGSAPLFQATGGAVTTYRIDGMSFDDLVPMGDRLLAFHNTTTTTLYLLTGIEPEIVATATLGGLYTPADLLQTGNGGLAIYEKASRSVRFLDEMLKELRIARLPADAVGDPVVSPDLNTVYYCTATGIHLLDLGTGIARLLQENDYSAAQTLTGILFSGAYLRHQATLADGTTATMLVNAQTGHRVYTGVLAANTVTDGSCYFLTEDCGSIQQLIFGDLSGTSGVLCPTEAIRNHVPLPRQNALIAIYPEDTSCRFAYYDLTAGKHTADVTLPGLSQIHSICAGVDGTVWFCAYDSAAQTSFLHRWDTSLSPTGSDTVVTGTYYPQRPGYRGSCRPGCQSQPICVQSRYRHHHRRGCADGRPLEGQLHHRIPAPRVRSLASPA